MIGDERPAGVRRIIAFRPGAIGDTLLTFPAFHVLRRRFPGTELTVVGNRPALELGRLSGLLDQAAAFGADWVADLFGEEPTPDLRERLRRFDLGMVWLHDSGSADDLASRLARAGMSRTFAAVSFPAPGTGQHLADHLRDTLPGRETGRDLDEGKVDPSPETSSPFGLHLPAASPPTRTSRVVLHPGAGGRRKRWAAERFAEVARRFHRRGFDVALTRGAADEDAVTATQRALGDSPVRVLADLPLVELASHLAAATVFIGNDSGVTHLAAMLGVPTVALFGPYDPAYWAPIGPRVAVVDAGPSCPHRSDPREGCRQCAVLDSLDVETVWSAAERVLG